MKKLSKITICLFMILSFLFVENVRAEDDIQAIENMITKSGGKEECPSNSYVCLMGLSAVRITYYEDGKAKEGYNVFNTKNMSEKKWSNWLNNSGVGQIKTTRYGTGVNHRIYGDIVNAGDWRLNTKSKQNKFYKGVKKGIQKLDQWVIEIINKHTGQNFTSSSDENLKNYISNSKVYFVIEPLYFFKVQDLKTADEVGFGQRTTPVFRRYLYTANQIGKELVSQTSRCKSAGYGVSKCEKVYSDRSDHPHTKKIATNMRLKKAQIELSKGVSKKTYKMKDLVEQKEKTGLGVGVIKLKYGTVKTGTPDYVCYPKTEYCDQDTYSITEGVSYTKYTDSNGATCTNGNYSQSEYGVVTFLEKNQFCHVYCTKDIEFNIPKSYNGAFKTPWATANFNDNFTITKTGNYDCKVDFEYYYGDSTNPAWLKKTALAVYGDKARITRAQALLAQNLENVRSTRDTVCPGKDLETCAIEATGRACPTTSCVSGSCDFSEINTCVNSFGTNADGSINFNDDPNRYMAFHYAAWVNNWNAIKESYAECANYAPNNETMKSIFPENEINVTDTDGNTYNLKPDGEVDCTGDCDPLYVVDYGLKNEDGTPNYIIQKLPGSAAMTQKSTKDSSGKSYPLEDKAQATLAKTVGLCQYWNGVDGATTGIGYDSICLLKRFYESRIESRGSFSINVDYTYKPTKNYKADFNKNFELTPSSDESMDYNSFSNQATKYFASGSDNICKWDNSKFNNIFGKNTGDNQDNNQGNANKITFNLGADSDAAKCKFTNTTIEMKKTLSNETCACPSNTVHAGTNAYYWINNDLLTNTGVIEKFKEGATCAEAISMVCRDSSLNSDSNGYEEPTDLNGEPITDCLISGIKYQDCVSNGSKTYKCQITNKYGNTATSYIDADVYEAAKKQGVEIDKKDEMNKLANKVCSSKYGTCDDNNDKKFIYRTVQLNSGSDIKSDKKISFPGVKGIGRTPGLNWSDNDIETVLKTDNANYSGTPMYTIILNHDTIKHVRDYNKSHTYDDVENLKCGSTDSTTSACVSNFVHDEQYGIQKSRSKCGNVTSDPNSFYSTGCVNYYGRSS